MSVMLDPNYCNSIILYIHTYIHTRVFFFLPFCRFVEKYTEFESQGELEKQSLFEETGKALLAEGLVLRRRRGTPAVSRLFK